MSKYYQQAEQLVQRVVEDLQKLLPHDGEDISFYNLSAVDTSILNLVKVRTLLGCAERDSTSNIIKEKSDEENSPRQSEHVSLPITLRKSQ